MDVQKRTRISTSTFVLFSLLKLFFDPTPATGLKDKIEKFHSHTLYKHLFDSYLKGIIPKSNTSQKLIVGVGLVLTRIDKISEKDQQFTSYAWLTLTWRDEFLTWNQSSFGNISKFAVESEMVWIPELLIRNTKDRSVDIGLEQKTRVQVFSTGQVVWGSGMTLKTHCDIDMTYFPWDIQVCHIEFSALNYFDQIKFVPFKENINKQTFKKNPQWELKKTKIRTYDLRLTDDENGKEVVNIVYATFVLQRQPTYYTMLIVVPSFLIILVTGFALLLPFNSGEKVSLGVTILLSYTMLLILLSNIMPENSLKFPDLAIHLVINMVMSATILITTILHQRLYNTSPKKELPFLLRIVALTWFQKFFDILCCSYLKQKRMNARKNSPKISVGIAITEIDDGKSEAEFTENDKTDTNFKREEIRTKLIEKGVNLLEKTYFIFYMLFFLIYITILITKTLSAPSYDEIDDSLRF